MKLIKYMGMTLVVSTFASCTNDDKVLSAWESDPQAVRIQAIIGNKLVSRSNPIGPNENEFNQGDQLSIQADEQGRYTYTLTNGTWNPIGTNYLTWKTETININAYTVLNGATQTSFTVPTDQSEMDKIASADYMTFTGTCTQPHNSSNITMQLKRQTARIDIMINQAVSSSDSQPITNFTIAGNSEIKNGKSSKIATFTPYAQEGTQYPTYSVLVAPNNEKKANETFITLTVNGNPMTVTGIPQAAKGKKYSYKLNIGENAVTLNNVSVTDWTTGDIFDGGEIGSYPVKVDKTNHTIITKQEGKLTANHIQQAKSKDGELIITGPLNSSDLTTLGQNAKSGITSIDLSKAITTTVPTGAFKDCKSLASLTIPTTVTSIGDEFISGCNNLVSLIIMSSKTTLPTIKSSAFTGFDNAGNCDLRLDSSRNDQIDANAKKNFGGKTWKSILDLNGSEFTGTDEGGNIGGEGSDYPIE